MGIITFTTIRQNHPNEGKIVQALPIYLGFPACAPLKMFDLNKHSILLRPFPLKEDSDAPTKNQIVDMVDICSSKGYQDYAIHSVQLICVQFSYTYVYANYTHIKQIHIHILSDIYIDTFCIYISNIYFCSHGFFPPNPWGSHLSLRWHRATSVQLWSCGPFQPGNSRPTAA